LCIDDHQGIPNAKKKFAELELSLFHLQQNVEIPETHLIIHPIIQKAVDSARESQTRITISIIPAGLLNDSSFLNTLQSHVNTWIKAIQSVTKLSRDVTSGTASQEINFWLSLERALEAIDAQLHSDEVGLVLDCLRNAKRYLATVSFTADTGLKEGMELVRRYNYLMKDFPLDELLSATDLEKIQDSLGLIFNHLNNRLRRVPYPIRRALPLVEAISRDFNDTLLRVLTSHRLIYQPYDTFEKLMNTTMNVFRSWDDYIKDFTNVAREVTRKRSEKFIPIKINPAHGKLVERARYLRDWRKQHEQLAVTTAPTKGLGGVVSVAGVVSGGGIGAELGGVDMEEEVKEAYEIIKSIDILDVSLGGPYLYRT
jgi:dynein heavy chain 1